MQMSRVEEMIYREVLTLAGDLNQIGTLMAENHEERLKEAELQNREPKLPRMIRTFNGQFVLRDINFIRARLEVLAEYVKSEVEK